ncbi:MAG: hypothetical protein C4547_11110 [Phycisphaerales bacterium]|nr:MAG: hypothetical protein C4547_11110 [Phycisphaerales bacterium]
MPILALIFRDALEVSGPGRAALILPLCLAIAIVYKTIRCEDLRRVPRAAAALWITIVVGMYAVGIGLWLLFRAMV